ncbi:hypothetical protein NDU88_003406 [Pleurodeles waltl]|uniref:Uncharacterized protein n=1 Tax=Pleurodeles waltl TaxID=8319 RepID=A0AAV7SEF4_PLEWA|nr:hypothetical protein NDU88_003406 [Pleurodeles waltl]
MPARRLVRPRSRSSFSTGFQGSAGPGERLFSPPEQGEPSRAVRRTVPPSPGRTLRGRIGACCGSHVQPLKSTPGRLGPSPRLDRGSHTPPLRDRVHPRIWASDPQILAHRL